MKRIAVCVGGRPNYIKLAPIVRAIDAVEDLECYLIDAGQHYSANMRNDLFKEVGLRKNNAWFDIGSGSHSAHTSDAMLKMEALIKDVCCPFDAVLVHGDMDYALGCALAAAKLHIPVIHNEAGLRSNDRRMPEEINRILIDHMADYHLVTEQAATDNLQEEGIFGSYLTGSTLVESIRYACPEGAADGCTIPRYAVVTLHRPENVDDMDTLRQKWQELIEVNRIIKVKMICHPRTRQRINDMAKIERDGIDWQDAVGYGQMLYLLSGASLVITDSGGLQEETTILDIPCLTWRDNTERPITILHGTNRLVQGNLRNAVEKTLDHPPSSKLLLYWDGTASKQTVEILRRVV